MKHNLVTVGVLTMLSDLRGSRRNVRLRHSISVVAEGENVGNRHRRKCGRQVESLFGLLSSMRNEAPETPFSAHRQVERERAARLRLAAAGRGTKLAKPRRRPRKR